MYKVVVVDDKKDVIEGIICMGNWESMSCVISGKAYNGEEALRIIKEIKPQIVITDIRMPKMDGIELTRQIKIFDESIKVIILSGYDEFSYAQQAVKLGAEEYLLKPAEIHMISEAVSRCAEKLEKEKSDMESKILRKQRLIQSLPLLRDEFFQSLINQDIGLNDSLIQKKMEFLKLSLDYKKVMILAIDIDNICELRNKGGHEEIELYKFGVKNIIEDVLVDYGQGAIFTVDNKIALVIDVDKVANVRDNYNRIKKLGHKICDAVKEYLNITVTIAVNKSMVHIKNIGNVYRELEKNLSYKLYLGDNCLITEEQISKHKESTKGPNPQALEKELLLSIKHGETKEAIEFFERLFKALLLWEKRPTVFKAKIFEIMLTIGHLCDQSYESKDISEFKELSGFDDIRDYVKVYIEDRANIIQLNKKSPIEKSMDRGKEFIHLHYAENINLQKTAEHVCMSPTYFSAVFKEYVNQSFIEYLISYRIKMAKEFLLSGNYKIYEVAAMVGYSDRRYFSEVFKKHVGMKPKEYSRVHKNKNTPLNS